MALIECTIRRKGGSVVTLDGGTAKYHFKPNEKGQHVATVDNQGHVERLLSISGTYRLAEPAASVPPADAQVLQRDGGSDDAGGMDEVPPPAETSEPPKPRRRAAKKTAKPKD